MACAGILYGVEAVVLSEKTYGELEQIQASFGREVLGVRSTCSSYGVIADLGLKTMRHRVYEQKLRFFNRISSPSFPDSRLARKALREVTSPSWNSDFYADIVKIKRDTGVWRGSSPEDVMKILDNWVLKCF